MVNIGATKAAKKENINRQKRITSLFEEFTKTRAKYLFQNHIPLTGTTSVRILNKKYLLALQVEYNIWSQTNTKVPQVNAISLLPDWSLSEIMDIISKMRKCTNHIEINKLYSEVQRKYYYPRIKDFTQNYINNCEICYQSKYDRNPPKELSKKTPTPSKVRGIYISRKDRQWDTIVNALTTLFNKVGKPTKTITGLSRRKSKFILLVLPIRRETLL